MDFVFIFFLRDKKKNVVHELESINVTEIIDKINSNQINSNWLYLKGKIKILSNNDKVSLGVSLKIRKDSLIWASISAPIIGEINRIMITPDSLYVINRTNSTWSTQPIGQLKKEIGTPLSYYDIQNFLSNTVKIPVQLKKKTKSPTFIMLHIWLILMIYLLLTKQTQFLI